MPLGDIPFFGDRDTGGHLSGKLAMDGIGDKPSLQVDLHMDDLKVGHDVAYERAAITLDIAKQKAAEGGGERSPLKLAVELAGKVGGRLTTTVAGEVAWENGLVPTLDQDRALQLDLLAQRFRIAAAGPFVAGVLSRVDGVLDGASHVEWSLNSRKAAKLGQVKLTLKDGVLNLPALGQELHNVSLDIAAGEQGKVQINDLRAEGAKGLLTGKGYAQFDGLWFRKAELQFDIKSGAELPITLGGVPYGDASGQISLAVTAPKGELDLVVGIPALHIDLAPGLGRQVEGTEDNPDITVLQAIRSEDLPPPPGGGRKIVLTLNPVHIEVAGKVLGKVPVDATITASKTVPIRIEIGAKHPRVSGVVNLPRAKIELLHKQFVIEGGTVRLNPDDVSRSFVNATARWDSPDGPVFVEFVGEVSPMTSDKLKEKLKCRSGDLSQERCFSALLVGPEGNNPGSAQGAAQGQALATQLIASEFSTQIAGGLSTSLGTADDGSFRPGLQYNAGKNAVIELSTYGMGGGSGATTTSAGAAAPKGQHSLLTIDWRFWRNWSLRGKADVGSDQQTYGADVLWQFRY